MIALASDHGGFSLKQAIIKRLEDQNIEFKDYGCYDGKSCDYSDFALLACEAVVSGEAERAILICGTGIGISIAANKVMGMRAAVCTDEFTTKYTRLHNDANAMCLGARVTGEGVALEMVDTFLSTPFEGGRHKARIDKVAAIERSQRLK